MVIWMVVIVAAGVAAGIGLSVACVKLRDRHVRLTLGIPDSVQGDTGELRASLAAKAVADTEMKINAAAPRMKPEQRRRLALALARSRGLLAGKGADPD
jgi:hypothetical protein